MAADSNRNEEVTEAEAVGEAITMPRVTMFAISVEVKDTGPEIVRMEHHRNSQRRLRLQRQPRLWIARLSEVG